MPDYSGLALRTAANNKMPVWTIAVTENIFMAGAVFVINARNSVCPSYCAYSYLFDILTGSLLFSLLDKFMAALKYSGIYKFSWRMATNYVSTDLALHRYSEVDWAKTAVRDEYVPYDSQTVKVIGMEVEIVQARMPVRRNKNAPTSVIKPAMPVYFHTSIMQVTFEVLRGDYNKYRGLADEPDETIARKDAEAVSLDGPVDGLLRGQTGYDDDEIEAALDAKRFFETTAGDKVPSLMNRYTELVRDLGDWL